MNEFVWHVDPALLSMVEKPLAVMGIVFGVLSGIIVALVIYALRRSK